MANTDIAVYQSAPLESRLKYAEAMMGAGNLLPSGFNHPGKVLLMFEQAAALGVPPITGLSNIHIIEGKPSLSSNMMAGLVRREGHKLRVKATGEGAAMKAVAQLIRADDPDFTFEVTWSMKDAEAAGLAGKGNWKKYPRSMLKARAISEVCREGANDVLLGAVYTPEELNPDLEVDELGELVHQPTQDSAGQANGGSRPRTPETTPIVPQAGADGEVAEWIERVDAVMDDADALLALFNDGRKAGKLHLKVDEETELGQYIIELGKRAKARAEGGDAAAAAADTGADTETGEVPEEDVVDAEVVEDEEPEPDPEPPMAMQGGDEPPNPVRARRAPRK